MNKGDAKAMPGDKLIGVIGGVGPYAGLDLLKKIFDQTIASKDADHLSVILLSEPEAIPCRTEFLLDQQSVNPGIALLERLRRLEEAGAQVAGIPCNTSHAQPIMGLILEKAREQGLKIKLLDMVQEVVDHCKKLGDAGLRPGVLATIGSYRTSVYQKAFKKAGVECVLPSQETMKSVHKAIYDTEFGIKARSNPVSGQARDMVLAAILELKTLGAKSVVLGCTELPLAVPETDIYGIPVIDSTLILARALIRESAPHKLRPYQG